LIIIGEKINSSIKKVAAAIEKRDEEFLRKLARDQVTAGSHFLEVNAGVFIEQEKELMQWLVNLVQDVTDVPLCIDSPNPKALEAGLAVARGRPILNSISLEKQRYAGVIPLVKQHKTGIIALCMDDDGIPRDTKKKVSIARALVKKLTDDGVAMEDIYLDVMLQPIATDGDSGQSVLQTTSTIRQEYPGVHITCGLSNGSFELPCRKLLNQAFAVAMVSHGMDVLMVDPLDARMMSLLSAINTVMGHDEFCEAYLDAHRGGRLVV
jgi:cobalamin-dependent methionine synthase I